MMGFRFTSILSSSATAIIKYYAGMLEECVNLRSLQDGRKIHALIITKGLFQAESVYILNHLVNMYTRIYKKRGDEAMNIFQHMRQQGAMPDWITLTTVVGICSGKLGIAEGKQVHACAIRLGLEGDVYVGNALIDIPEFMATYL
ncbi:hypothetical protein SUGI_0238520 [Cryptomeria japonica]|nr:hypothetical protein SUGI_0238520 [Cryptomeria japonica]